MNTWLPTVSLHSLVIVVSILAYILTTRAERARRPPSIAIAWVLGMIALPYLALPMYLMFGRRKLPRKTLRALRRKIRCAALGEGSHRKFRLAGILAGADRHASGWNGIGRRAIRHHVERGVEARHLHLHSRR